MKRNRSFSRTTAALVCGMLVVPVLVTSVPTQAYAFSFGGAEAVAAKEYILDTVVWRIKQAARAAFVKSTVNWINSGFKGSPAFVTNLRENLLIVGDSVASDFFNELSGSIIDSPYQDQITTAIRTGYYVSTGGSFYVRNPFTLNQYSNDPAAFLGGDFSQGGLSAWFSTAMNSQNNPYTSYELALQELDTRLASAGGRRISELNWADGFKSFRGNCDETPTYTGTSNVQLTTLGGSGTVGADGSIDITTNTTNASLSQLEPCREAGIRTPGAIIAPNLNKALGAGQDELINADEINEIVGALFAQLVNKALGSTGLVSVSGPSYGGGRPVIDQATERVPVSTTPVPSDPAVEARLAPYEANWKVVASLAGPAVNKCPQSAVAQKAAADAAAAQARVDGIRQALQQPGASSDLVTDLLPTDADLAQAQAASSDTDGSIAKQLLQIVALRGCPSN